MSADPVEPLSLNCPGCQEQLHVPVDTAGALARCPYCGTQFFASAELIALEVVDDTESGGEHDQPRAELDGNRIRQLTALRRGAIRSRSWCQIAAVIGVAVAAELLFKAAQNLAHTHALSARGVGLVLFAVVSAAVGRSMWRTAGRLTAEIDAPNEAEDIVEPDFSTLSDGSQRWKNLEEIR